MEAELIMDDNPRTWAKGLEGLIAINEDYLRGQLGSFYRPLYHSGVVYRPERAERWKSLPKVYEDGHGDCEDVAAIRVAELRASGRDPAAKIYIYKTGPNRWHAIVSRSNGRLEDPTKILKSLEKRRKQNAEQDAASQENEMPANEMLGYYNWADPSQFGGYYAQYQQYTDPYAQQYVQQYQDPYAGYYSQGYAYPGVYDYSAMQAGAGYGGYPASYVQPGYSQDCTAEVEAYRAELEAQYNQVVAEAEAELARQKERLRREAQRNKARFQRNVQKLKAQIARAKQRLKQSQSRLRQQQQRLRQRQQTVRQRQQQKPRGWHWPD